MSFFTVVLFSWFCEKKTCLQKHDRNRWENIVYRYLAFDICDCKLTDEWLLRKDLKFRTTALQKLAKKNIWRISGPSKHCMICSFKDISGHLNTGFQARISYVWFWTTGHLTFVLYVQENKRSDSKVETCQVNMGIRFFCLIMLFRLTSWKHLINTPKQTNSHYHLISFV